MNVCSYDEINNKNVSKIDIENGHHHRNEENGGKQMVLKSILK